MHTRNRRLTVTLLAIVAALAVLMAVLAAGAPDTAEVDAAERVTALSHPTPGPVGWRATLADSEAQSVTAARLVAYAHAVEQAQVRDYLQALHAAEAERQRAERVAAEKARQKRQARAPATAVASAPSSPSGNVALGQQMAANRGWVGAQWSCLYTLWDRESGWNHTVWNHQGSGAFGIPQAKPGSKMASHGADWQTNPATQISWGISYIGGRYGDPCSALDHHDRRNWY